MTDLKIVEFNSPTTEWDKGVQEHCWVVIELADYATVLQQ